MKKSQITLLIIVGLVSFMAVGLVLYISNAASTKKVTDSLVLSQETSFESQPVQDFVANCIDQLGKEAIVLMGKQGGNIYESQGGIIPDKIDADKGFSFAELDGTKVDYNILYTGPFPPSYPRPSFPYNDLNSPIENFNGVFGVRQMWPLEEKDGPNSFELQIKSYIDNKLRGCANLEYLEEYEIDMGDSSTSVTFGNENVVIKAIMPLKLTNKKTRETFGLNEFNTILDIELKQTYLFVDDLIKKDVSDALFSIDATANNVNNRNVEVIKNVFENDDIVAVTDSNSLIQGRPFKYYFGRDNRPPALRLIRPSARKKPSAFVFNSPDDVVPDTELISYDPDEDVIDLNDFEVIPQKTPPNFPWNHANLPEEKTFRIEVTDGVLKDYQPISYTWT